MLRVDYKEVLGYFVSVEHQADGVHYFKIGIYGCNALAAFVHRYISKYDGKLCGMLYAFFADKVHMKNIEKDHTKENPFFEIKGVVRLNKAYPKECKELTGFFSRQGYAIEYFSKPYKERRPHVRISAADECAERTR